MRWIVVVMAVLVAAGCGADEEARSAAPREQGPTTTVDEGSTESSPFTVGPVPEGYVPLVAGVGTGVPAWGQDCCGTDEPLTVLSPDGTVDHPDAVLVTATAWEEGFYEDEGVTHTPSEADLDDALFTPEGEDPAAGGAVLTVRRGKLLAVRVVAAGATRAELEAVVRAVALPVDQVAPPEVPEPPDGLVVAATMRATTTATLSPHIPPDPDGPPGPEGAHVAGWVTEAGVDGPQLIVAALPGAGTDVEALAVVDRVRSFEPLEVRPATIGAVEGVVVDTRFRDEEAVTRRSVWWEAPWGDLMVVIASGDDLPDEEALLDLAATVERADAATWDGFVAEVTGGDEVRPDVGHTELLRGTAPDGREWLLQSGFDTGLGGPVCLKLAHGDRACTSSSSGGGGLGTYAADGDEMASGLSFVIVATDLPGAAVRVTTTEGEVVEPLVPDGTRRLAVVFAGPVGLSVCDPARGLDGPEGPLAAQRVEVLDADGAVLGCNGI